MQIVQYMEPLRFEEMTTILGELLKKNCLFHNKVDDVVDDSLKYYPSSGTEEPLSR